MRVWYICCLCVIASGSWLYYYCHDEPASAPHRQEHQQHSSSPCIAAYRNLPPSTQKRICHRAQQVERLFFPDAQHYRFAIIRTFLSGGYQQYRT